MDFYETALNLIRFSALNVELAEDLAEDLEKITRKYELDVSNRGLHRPLGRSQETIARDQADRDSTVEKHGEPLRWDKLPVRPDVEPTKLMPWPKQLNVWPPTKLKGWKKFLVKTKIGTGRPKKIHTEIKNPGPGVPRVYMADENYVLSPGYKWTPESTISEYYNKVDVKAASAYLVKAKPWEPQDERGYLFIEEMEEKEEERLWLEAKPLKTPQKVVEVSTAPRKQTNKWAIRLFMVNLGRLFQKFTGATPSRSWSEDADSPFEYWAHVVFTQAVGAKKFPTEVVRWYVSQLRDVEKEYTDSEWAVSK